LCGKKLHKPDRVAACRPWFKGSAPFTTHKKG